MKSGRNFLALLMCLVVLGFAWILVVTEESDEQIQKKLIKEASVLVEDKIYIRAEPILEEAIECSELLRLDAEQLLKEVYWGLIEEVGYKNKLTALFEKQVNREGTPTEIYLEAMEYYQGYGMRKKAIEALRIGYEKTGDPDLLARYEQERYSFLLGGETYEYVTEVYNDRIQVQKLGEWGLADYYGELIIPCQYDKISTFSAERAVVKDGNEIFSIDEQNHRIYLLKTSVLDFGNYGNDLIGFQTEEGWIRGTGEFLLGSMTFEELGMYNAGYAAAKYNGKWGVIDTEAEWFIEPVYDEILMDTIGRCYEQNAVFACDGNQVYLFVDGQRQDEVYEDAWPFYEQGWAAVKKNGKWGFIDAAGQVMIDYQYMDARSFSGHLAAVKVEEFWGYISMDNRLVIDDLYYDVRGFVNGVAAVKNMDGWQFIILDEYREDRL